MSEPYQMPKTTLTGKKDRQESPTRPIAPTERSGELLCFALLALEVSARVRRFQPKGSPMPLSQPQVIALLCLMCREGWSPSQAHAHLVANDGLRAALKFAGIPENSVFCSVLQQAGQEKDNIAMLEMVQRILGHSNFLQPVSDRSA
jgi:hypothetical protein